MVTRVGAGGMAALLTCATVAAAPLRPDAAAVPGGSEQAPRVWLSLATDPVRLVQRQSARLTLEACAEGVLQWRRPALAAREGYLLRPLGETEVVATRDGVRCTATRWHWALLPTVAGALQVEPPMLQATKFGQPLRFSAPSLALQVDRVPAWLPLDVPVGSVSVALGEPSRAGAAEVRQPWPLRFVVTGDVTPHALRALLLDQLPADPVWTAYPPEIRAVAGDSTVPQHEVTLYALPSQAGRLDLPALRLPWFDPGSAALRQARLPAMRIDVVDPVRAALWRSAAALALAVLLIAAGVAIWRRQRWRLRRRRLERALRVPMDADRLHAEVLGFDLSAVAPPAPTLGAWRARMEAQCSSGDLPGLVDTLERLRYASGGAELAQAQEALRRWLRSLRPRTGGRRASGD